MVLLLTTALLHATMPTSAYALFLPGTTSTSRQTSRSTTSLLTIRFNQTSDICLAYPLSSVQPHGFCPTLFHKHQRASKKDFITKCYYSRKSLDTNQTKYDPKIYISSKWEPPEWLIPPIIMRCYHIFARRLQSIVKKSRRSHTNLLWFQHLALCRL